MSLTAQTYWAEHAWLGDRVEPGVVIRTLPAADGRITEVRPRVAAPPIGSVTLRGLTLPGLANAHSHAFHRALRGTVQVGSGTFWTWRETMYDIAARLDPDSYFALARAVYAEMALAGITCVGEFHYLHHQPDGTPYGDPNAMGEALIAAAADAGIRITLLDTAYLHGGLASGGYRPLEGVQRRFGDGTAERWRDRWSRLAPREHARIGAALHSVRAFSAADGYQDFARWTEGVPTPRPPLRAARGERGVPGGARPHPGRAAGRRRFLAADAPPRCTPRIWTADDIRLLGEASVTVCMCPTTERDLADGIGPAARLAAAGSPLSLGSDSHAVIDILEEARAMELDERLSSRTRGHWSAAGLLRAATGDGHASLGWPEAGRIETGALADLTTIALDSPRTAGTLPRLGAETAVFAATSADVRHTVVGGRHVVRDGAHQLVPDVPGALAEAIGALRD